MHLFHFIFQRCIDHLMLLHYWEIFEFFRCNMHLEHCSAATWSETERVRYAEKNNIHFFCAQTQWEENITSMIAMIIFHLKYLRLSPTPVETSLAELIAAYFHLADRCWLSLMSQILNLQSCTLAVLYGSEWNKLKMEFHCKTRVAQFVDLHSKYLSEEVSNKSADHDEFCFSIVSRVTLNFSVFVW